MMQMGPFGGTGNRFVPIRRNALLQDGYEQLTPLGPEGLKGRVRVQFFSEHGEAEAGVVGLRMGWDWGFTACLKL